MNKVFCLKSSFSVLAMMVGVAVSTSALADVSARSPNTITSAATTQSVKGRPPAYTSAKANWADTNGNGIIDTGDVITAVPEGFSDADGDGAITPDYSWYRDDVLISGAKAATYTLVAADIGASVTVRITPKTDPLTSDPAVGNSVASNTVNIVTGSTVTGVTIAGNTVVGETLTANATCLTACIASDLTYQWQLESRSTPGVYADITGATSKTYVLKGNEQKLKLKVKVSSK